MTKLNKIKVNHWMGFLTACFLGNAIETWFGLEYHIAHLRQNWIDVHWMVWVIPAVICIVISARLESEDG